ncbi:hemin uptake protein HemP [bacterium]|nr:hemin uptake protein HemP [bacterium]
MNDQKAQTETPAVGQPPVSPIRFRDLAQGVTEVLVEHEGQVYRLRLTRNGKLILNK